MKKIFQYCQSTNKGTLFPFILILLYLFFALIKIKYPGVQYDELQFGNIARGEVDSTFVRYSFGHFPVLMMSYVGALKAYLYFPIFKIFGVSAYSIRIPMIAISAVGFCFLYSAVKKYFNKSLALLSLFIIVLDPSFIAFSRYDVGPTTLEFLCKVVVYYFLVLYLERRTMKHAIYVYAFLVLGLFNKLNFIWFVNGLFISLIIVNREYWFRILRRKPNKKELIHFIYLCAGYFILVGYFFFISKAYLLLDPASLVEIAARWKIVLPNIYDLITGVGYYKYVFGNLDLSLTKYIFFFYIFFLFVGFVQVVYSDKIDSKYKKGYFFLLLIIIFTIAQIFVTKEADNPWHFFSIYPTYSILFSYSVYLTIQALYPIGKKRKVIAFGVISIIAFYQIFIDVRYIDAYGKPAKNIFWSNSIYNLIDYTQSNPHKFASVDWGMHTQLITFSGQRDKYVEISFVLNDDKTFKEDKQWLFDAFLNPIQNYCFIVHPDDEGLFPNAKRNLFNLAEEYDISLGMTKIFSDENGKVIYEIYTPRYR
jgi:hypothetical protein